MKYHLSYNIYSSQHSQLIILVILIPIHTLQRSLPLFIQLIQPRQLLQVLLIIERLQQHLESVSLISFQYLYKFLHLNGSSLNNDKGLQFRYTQCTDHTRRPRCAYSGIELGNPEVDVGQVRGRCHLCLGLRYQNLFGEEGREHAVCTVGPRINIKESQTKEKWRYGPIGVLNEGH
jgi:hypothetical protein